MAQDTYAGFTRFQLELEFVQALANPHYLHHLAQQKLLADPAMVAYLDYLQYFTRPEYARYLQYPTATLKALELLQQDRFRKDIASPELLMRIIEDSVKVAMQPR